MTHHFDIDTAQELGVTGAILIANFQFWIAKNVANSKHFHDDRHWTYNSVKAFSKLFFTA